MCGASLKVSSLDKLWRFFRTTLILGSNALSLTLQVLSSRQLEVPDWEVVYSPSGSSFNLSVPYDVFLLSNVFSSNASQAEKAIFIFQAVNSNFISTTKLINAILLTWTSIFLFKAWMCWPDDAIKLFELLSQLCRILISVGTGGQGMNDCLFSKRTRLYKILLFDQFKVFWQIFSYVQIDFGFFSFAIT